MSNDEYDEDQPTPPHACAPLTIEDQPNGLSDSQRQWFAERFQSGAPVIRQPVEVPYPTALISRTTTPDELRMLRQNRLAGDQSALAEHVVKMHSCLIDLAKAFNDRNEQDSSDNQAALQELRALLSKPPNGRVRALATQVGELDRVTAERFDALERQLAARASTERVEEVKDDHRFKSLEGDARFARRAAQAVIVFLILAIGGAGIWIGIREQKLETVIETLKDHDHKLDRLLSRQKDTP